MRPKDKGHRNFIAHKKYKKRVARWIAQGGSYRNEEGRYDIFHSKYLTSEALESNQCHYFKAQAVPCSCYSCSGYYKYPRWMKKERIIS